MSPDPRSPVAVFGAFRHLTIARCRGRDARLKALADPRDFLLVGAGWIYREFPATGKAKKTATGQVKNPLEHFPPKTPEAIDTAKVELRNAYSKDFAEYVEKKVFGGKTTK